MGRMMRILAHRLRVAAHRYVEGYERGRHDERRNDVSQWMVHDRFYRACVAIKSCMGLDALA